MSLDLRSAGSAERVVPVEAVHTLRLEGPVASLPLEVLWIGGGEIEDLRVSVDGHTAEVAWRAWDEEGARGRIPLPPGIEDGGRVVIRTRYDVRRPEGREGRVRIPVVRIPWSPEEAAPGTFTARARLGDAVRVAEAFPTVVPTVEGEGAARTHRLELHAVPAVLTYHLAGPEGLRLGFTGAVDLAVGVLLVVLGAWGWIALRRRSRALAREVGPGGGHPRDPDER